MSFTPPVAEPAMADPASPTLPASVEDAETPSAENIFPKPNIHSGLSAEDKDKLKNGTFGPIPQHKACSKCHKSERTGQKLLACGKCERVWYCNVECQKADWKRHKPQECKPWTDARDKAIKMASTQPARAQFTFSAEAWPAEQRAEMEYAVRCGLRLGVKGDISRTHALVMKWDFHEQATSERHRFTLYSAEVVTLARAGELYEEHVGGDPDFAWSLSPEGLLKKHGIPPKIAKTCNIGSVLNLYRYTERKYGIRVGEHWFWGLSIINWEASELNLIDENWKEILIESLASDTAPSVIDLLFQQFARRADGGTAEAVEQGYLKADGQTPGARNNVPGQFAVDPDAPLERSKESKSQKKRRKKKEKKGAETDPVDGVKIEELEIEEAD